MYLKDASSSAWCGQAGDAAAEEKPPQEEPEEKIILKKSSCASHFTSTLLSARAISLNGCGKEHFQEVSGNELQTCILHGTPGDAGVPSYLKFYS